MMTIGMWMWGVGILVTLVFLPRFSKFNGTRYRTRMLFSLWMCLFLSAANYFMFQPASRAVGIGIGIGLILTIPAVIWYYLWFRRRLQKDMVVRYPPHAYKRSLIRNLPIVVALLVLFHFVGIEKLKEHSFALVALCVSWFLCTIFGLVHIARLEARCGKHILEETAAT